VNVGSGTGTTLAELAQRIVRLTNSTSPVHIGGTREQEVGRFVADIARGKRLLGIPSPEDPLWALPQMMGRP
jgi:nucleoside-diphosphate-sugar epimerase